MEIQRDVDDRACEDDPEAGDEQCEPRDAESEAQPPEARREVAFAPEKDRAEPRVHRAGENEQAADDIDPVPYAVAQRRESEG